MARKHPVDPALCRTKQRTARRAWLVDCLEPRLLLSSDSAFRLSPILRQELRAGEDAELTAIPVTGGTTISSQDKPDHGPAPTIVTAGLLATAVAANPTLEGIDFDTEATTSGFYHIPPDPDVAASPSHLVTVVNTTISFYTKTGTLASRQSLPNFFTSATVAGGSIAPSPQHVFDPKVIYDATNGRFVVVALDRTDTGAPYYDASNTSRLYVAVSKSSDPTAGWYVQSIDAMATSGLSDWADFPAVAGDGQALYLTANFFTFGGGSFAGSRLWILNAATLYGGTAPTTTVYNPSSLASLPGSAFTLQPAMMYGATGTYLVSAGWTVSGNPALSVIKLTNPLSSPTFRNTWVSLGKVDTMSAAAGAPQPGTSTLVDTGDNRMVKAVWRNNALWACDTVVIPSGQTDAGTSKAHWYKINAGTSISLAAQGNLDIGSGSYSYFPTLMLDASGNAVVGFAASSTSTYPGAYYATVNGTTNTASSAYVYAAGQDYYVRKFGGSKDRWGDYTGVALDPVDGATVWLFGEYALTRGTVLGGYPTEDGRWGTRIGRVSLSTGAAAGVVYNDFNGNNLQDGAEAGVAGITVFGDLNANGLLDAGEKSTTTDASGHYLLLGLTPGSYPIAEVLPANTVRTAAAAAVSLSAGSTASANLGNFPTLFAGASHYLRLDATVPGQLDIWIGTSAAGTPAYSIGLGQLSSLSFGPGSGDEMLTIDYAYGAPVPAGGIHFDGGAGTDTLQVIGQSPSQSFTLADGQIGLTGGPTVSYLNVETLTLAGGTFFTSNLGSIQTLNLIGGTTLMFG